MFLYGTVLVSKVFVNSVVKVTNGTADVCGEAFFTSDLVNHVLPETKFVVESAPSFTASFAADYLRFESVAEGMRLMIKSHIEPFPTKAINNLAIYTIGNERKIKVGDVFIRLSFIPMSGRGISVRVMNKVHRVIVHFEDRIKISKVPFSVCGLRAVIQNPPTFILNVIPFASGG
jgi:hypothetical protein